MTRRRVPRLGGGRCTARRCCDTRPLALRPQRYNGVVGEERREFQRLRIEPPIPATLGGRPVAVSEAGVLGARLEHDDPLEVEYADLRFDFGGRTLTLRCEFVRTITQSGGQRGRAESAVRFLAAVGDSGDALRAMLAQLVSEAFAARRAHRGGSLHAGGIDGDRTVRGKDAAFVCYRLDGSSWKRRRVFLPEQPATGFTVARGADDEEMQRLCQVYQASDDEGRRLIRLFAELSVSDVLEIPPRA